MEIYLQEIAAAAFSLPEGVRENVLWYAHSFPRILYRGLGLRSPGVHGTNFGSAKIPLVMVQVTCQTGWTRISGVLQQVDTSVHAQAKKEVDEFLTLRKRLRIHVSSCLLGPEPTCPFWSKVMNLFRLVAGNFCPCLSRQPNFLEVDP